MGESCLISFFPCSHKGGEKASPNVPSIDRDSARKKQFLDAIERKEREGKNILFHFPLLSPKSSDLSGREKRRVIKAKTEGHHYEKEGGMGSGESPEVERAVKCSSRDGRGKKKGETNTVLLLFVSQAKGSRLTCEKMVSREIVVQGEKGGGAFPFLWGGRGDWGAGGRESGRDPC